MLKDKITALYCRLSQDDGLEESNSITNQDVICQGVFLHLKNFLKIKGLNSFLILCCQRCESSLDCPASLEERTSAAGSTTDRLRVVSKCALILYGLEITLHICYNCN